MAHKVQGGSGLDERVRGLAVRFADDVARAVRNGLAEEVAAQVAEILRTATRGGTLRLQLGTGPGDGRIGKRPVPVRCPAPGCPNEGIRAKRNFCGLHSEQLGEAEKRKLRDAQLGAKAAPKGKPRRR